ncbi:MAG: FAD-dependent oxidoreductase, partial [Acetobacteraceae bacterium]
MQPLRVTVIRAGIAGVATAYLLARDGHDVTVLERRGAVALETSRANAGILTPSQASPWNEPGIARQALRFLLETDAKLVVTLHAEPWRFLWLARFLRNSAPARHPGPCPPVEGGDGRDGAPTRHRLRPHQCRRPHARARCTGPPRG